MNYYNDNDPKAVAWLEELIRQGSLPKGEVDGRSIEEVQAEDLRGFTQCHFFAGIGGWAYALQLAGWGPDRPVWTGSPPCQPFSVAGKRRGTEDERHLWPVWASLIRECKPSIIFGEQVASAIRLGWLDGVSDALEGQGYSCGAAVLPACGVLAPHIRQRLWWVADSDSRRQQGQRKMGQPSGTEAGDHRKVSGAFDVSTQHWHSLWLTCRDGKTRRIPAKAVPEPRLQPMAHGIPKGMDGSGPKGDGEKEEEVAGWPTPAVFDITDIQTSPEKRAERKTRGGCSNLRETVHDAAGWATPRGYPQEADPDLYPLAPSTKGRTGILKGAGNAIVPQVGAVFVRAFLEVKGEL